jgi:hypothetical protein
MWLVIHKAVLAKMVKLAFKIELCFNSLVVLSVEDIANLQ